MKQFELTEEDKKNIKNNCVSCGNDIYIPEYLLRGNYCQLCCLLANDMVDLRKTKSTREDFDNLFKRYCRYDLIKSNASQRMLALDWPSKK
jgi:hypothetical protein